MSAGIPIGFCQCGCGQPAPIAKCSRTDQGWVNGQPIRYIYGHFGKRNDMQPPNPSGICMCGCGQPTPLAKQSRAARGWVKGQPTRFAYGHGRTKGSNEVEHRPDGTTAIFVEYRGKKMECIIWTRDFEKVRLHHWGALWSPKTQNFYVRSTTRKIDELKKTALHMHRLLVPDCEDVDHINHDGLDNRVYDFATDTGNIRPTTHAENMQNRRTQAHSSRFKGVSWNARQHKWHAGIRKDGQDTHLGYFHDEETAARAYDAAAVEYFGEFAHLNFELDTAVV